MITLLLHLLRLLLFVCGGHRQLALEDLALRHRLALYRTAPRPRLRAELKGRVPGELHQALTAYAAYCRETTGQTIEPWPLVVQILQQFLGTDRDFQAWRRRTQNGPGAGPTTS